MELRAHHNLYRAAQYHDIGALVLASAFLTVPDPSKVIFFQMMDGVFSNEALGVFLLIGALVSITGMVGKEHPHLIFIGQGIQCATYLLIVVLLTIGSAKGFGEGYDLFALKLGLFGMAAFSQYGVIMEYLKVRRLKRVR